MEKLKEESQRWCSPDVSFHRKLKEHLGVGGLGATAKPWAGGRWRKPNPRGGSVTQEKALRQRVLPTPAPAGRNFRKPVGHVFCLPQMPSRVIIRYWYPHRTRGMLSDK